MQTTIYLLLSRETNGDWNEDRNWYAVHIEGFTLGEQKAKDWASKPSSNFELRMYQPTEKIL